MLTIKGSKYLWNCDTNGELIIEQKRLMPGSKDYETQAERRQAKFGRALENHRNAKHNGSRGGGDLARQPRAVAGARRR